MKKITNVSVWFDDRPGVEAGWVCRTTDYEDGRPVMGRIAMDEPLEAEDEYDARKQAAAIHGVRFNEVEVAT